MAMRLQGSQEGRKRGEQALAKAVAECAEGRRKAICCDDGVCECPKDVDSCNNHGEGPGEAQRHRGVSGQSMESVSNRAEMGRD